MSVPQVLLWVQCPSSAGGCRVKSCSPNINHMSPQQHCKGLTVSYPQKHSTLHSFASEWAFLWYICTFYRKGTLLSHWVDWIVLFCFTEFGWGKNSYGWITSRRQLRRTATNWKTEDFSFACGGIAGSNQIPRKGARPCAALLEKVGNPRHFPSGRDELALEKEFINIPKQILKCYRFALKLVRAFSYLFSTSVKILFCRAQQKKNNLVEVLGNFFSFPFLICKTFSYTIWRWKEYLTTKGDQLQMITASNKVLKTQALWSAYKHPLCSAFH